MTCFGIWVLWAFKGVDNGSISVQDQGGHAYIDSDIEVGWTVAGKGFYLGYIDSMAIMPIQTVKPPTEGCFEQNSAKG